MQTQKAAKAKKRYVKEDEAMRMKEDESEDTQKKPTEEVDGKLIKEDEEAEDSMEKEDEEEDEEDEEAEKDVFGGKDPVEEATESTTSGHTTTTNSVINTRQNVFVPSSNVKVSRESSSGSSMGQSPSEVHYGKSVSPDLLKSPMFVELNKAIEGMQASVSKKLEAIEKSMNDRVLNLQKTVSKMEEFYKSPFYKSIESDNPVMKKELSFQDKVSQGLVKYSD